MLARNIKEQRALYLFFHQKLIYRETKLGLMSNAKKIKYLEGYTTLIPRNWSVAKVSYEIKKYVRLFKASQRPKMTPPSPNNQALEIQVLYIYFSNPFLSFILLIKSSPLKVEPVRGAQLSVLKKKQNNNHLLARVVRLSVLMIEPARDTRLSFLKKKQDISKLAPTDSQLSVLNWKRMPDQNFESKADHKIN